MSSSHAGSCLALFLLSSALIAQTATGPAPRLQAPAPAAAHPAKKARPQAASSVEILNGTVATTVTFKPQRPASTHSHAPAPKPPAKGVPQKRTRTASSVDRVEIINGTKVETKIFKGVEPAGSATIAASSDESIVIGIASSESGQPRNRQPVVVGVASAGAVSAGKTVRPVAPSRRAKRPAYKPPASAAH